MEFKEQHGFVDVWRCKRCGREAMRIVVSEYGGVWKKGDIPLFIVLDPGEQMDEIVGEVKDFMDLMKGVKMEIKK